MCPPIDKVTFDGVWGDGSKYYPLPKYNVVAGKCYRVRMVGLMSQVSRLNVSIEGHSFTLLAVDGTDVKPLDVSSVALHAGERYDFQLCATQGHRLSLRGREFVIAAEAPELCEAEYLRRVRQPAPKTCRFQALLNYDGLLHAPAPASPPVEAPALDLGAWIGYTAISPRERPYPLKAVPDTSLRLYLGSLDDGRMYLHGARIPWKSPSPPLLVTKGEACAREVPVTSVPEHVADLELLIQSELDDLHVVHLHGSRFQVMGVADARDSLPDSPAPLTRDTIAVPPRGRVVLRLSVTNPGFWFLHALSANAWMRGAATALNVLPSKQLPVPEYVPTTACATPTLLI